MKGIKYQKLHYFQRYAFANEKRLIFITLIPFMVSVSMWLINICYKIYMLATFCRLWHQITPQKII